MNLAGRNTHNFAGSNNYNTNRFHQDFELSVLCDAVDFAQNENLGPGITNTFQSRYYNHHLNPFIRMRPETDSPTTMSTPSFDTSKQQHHDPVPTTKGSEPVVVQPSFDTADGKNDAVDHKPDVAGGGTSEWQQRSPTGDKGSSASEDMRSSAPTNDETITAPEGEGGTKRRGGHRRDLSAHFFEATTISEEATVPTKEGEPSPAAGQKHRRVFSGDVSNPAQAHRRINSIGNSTSIKRRSYGGSGQHHHRVDSAGLDVLTAAADVSREELAAAAGQRPRGSTPNARGDSWEPPAATPGTAPPPPSTRRSPVEMTSYDYSTMSAPPPRPRHSYPSATSGPPQPPPGSYVSSPVGPHLGPPPPYSQAGYPPYYAHPPPPHGHGYPRYPPPPPHAMGYPVQYARGGHDPYMKQPPAPLGAPAQPTLEHPGAEKSHRDPSPRGPPPTTSGSGEERGAAEEKRYRGEGHPMTPPAPVVPPSHWRGQGSHQGVQTYVTAIGVGEGARTMHPSAAGYHRNTGVGDPNVTAGHHRKLSSFSSLGPLSNIFQGPPPQGGEVAEQHPLKGGKKGHHRVTSSTVSFLRDLDVGLETSDATFLQNLQASNGVVTSKMDDKDAVSRRSPTSKSLEGSTDGTGTKLAAGGTSKRVRRKCTIENCPNRVVQGGLCIAHGAKRKTCKHPGCTKNVKKAGLCSTHGPARKRCEAEGCSKVAVQGGRCIAHGAKKKLCSVDSCTKQAILSGMCKKHHDVYRASQGSAGGVPPAAGGALQCKPVGAAKGKSKSGTHKKGHTRGLSIFQEMSADAVGTLLADEGIEGAAAPPASYQPQPPAEHSRGYPPAEYGHGYTH